MGADYDQGPEPAAYRTHRATEIMANDTRGNEGDGWDRHVNQLQCMERIWVLRHTNLEKYTTNDNEQTGNLNNDPLFNIREYICWFFRWDGIMVIC